MNDKTASIEAANISTPFSHQNTTEFSQSSLDVQVTEAICLRNRLIEINSANRAKAAQTLREIAHLLISGALGILLTFPCGVGQQTDENNSTTPQQGESEEVL